MANTIIKFLPVVGIAIFVGMLIILKPSNGWQFVLMLTVALCMALAYIEGYHDGRKGE